MNLFVRPQKLISRVCSDLLKSQPHKKSEVALLRGTYKRFMVSFVLCLTMSGAAAAAPDPPVCGAQGFTTAGGVRIDATIYGRLGASISLTAPIPTSGIRWNGAGYNADGNVEVHFTWPDTADFPGESYSRLSLPQITGIGPESRGTLQFMCGARNMGLMNYSLSRSGVSLESRERDITDCVDELERDGTYRISFEQGGVSHTLLRGRIALPGARLEATRYVQREVARGEAGMCSFTPPIQVH